jgi:outer membrane protein assembly factor BamB
MTAMALGASGLGAQAPPDRWPAFRGDGTSHTAAADLPTVWSADRNVAWRVPLAGHGQSSPVIWGDRVFVTAVDGDQKARLIVVCHRLSDGVELWRRETVAARRLADTDTTSKAAPTPAVDEDRVYAMFESGDVMAFRHDGTLVWRRSLMDEYGEIQNRHQYGGSPVLVRGQLVILVGHAGPSYLVSIDAATGATRWKAERPTVTTWATPVLVTTGEHTVIVVPTKNGIDAHTIEDGRVVWHRDGVVPAPLASPTVAGAHIVVASSARGGTGAVSIDGTRLEWQNEEIVNDFSSPLVHGGFTFFVNSVGVLQAVNSSTGRAVWRHRLPGATWASAIASGRRAYFFTTDGRTVVLEPGESGPGIVADNVLPIEGRVYGVAAVTGAFVMRTERELWRVGQ